MKKLLALLLLCLLPACALAEMDEDGDIVVSLPGAEFFFTPVDGACLTRESSKSEYDRAGLSQRELLAYMESMDVYALQFDAAVTTELQIMAYPTDDVSYDELTDFGAETLLSDYRYAYAEQGATVEELALYTAPEGHTFVRMVCSFQEGTEVRRVAQYMTCQHGYAIQILVYPYDGLQLGPVQLAVAESVADTLWVKAVE